MLGLDVDDQPDLVPALGTAGAHRRGVREQEMVRHARRFEDIAVAGRQLAVE